MAAVAGSPVSGTIGAVQAGQGQGQGNELVHELQALLDAGMDVACFDLCQGTLEQHLDIADHLTEVCACLHFLSAYAFMIAYLHIGNTFLTQNTHVCSSIAQVCC